MELNNASGITTEIVLALIRTGEVKHTQAGEVYTVIYSDISKALAGEPKVEKPTPAVPVKKSLTDDYIICLEDGKKFKSLKRHIRTHYDLSPEEYREKWGLPHDYPMVAPNYAAARSKLAKEMGLGQRRK